MLSLFLIGKKGLDLKSSKTQTIIIALIIKILKCSMFANGGTSVGMEIQVSQSTITADDK